LANVMAGSYDVALPAMSLLAWRCQPLRFVDFTQMVVGRAQGGTLLALPVATGWLVRHSWGQHLDVKVVAADSSWNMLRRARRRLQRAGIDAVCVRVDLERLPFDDGAFKSVLSHNGLHDFDDRAAALNELHRVTAATGLLAGSTLIRDHEGLTDRVLRLYERHGLAPMLRSKAFVYAELEALGGGRVLHESYGAVLFFTVDKGRAPLELASRASAH
jgi:ubiquinone/menaquinone biosynthesis C-methylase UbiE